jgi:hypothetical protein
MNAMSWGGVELEPEVRDLALDEEDQARVGFHVDRLAEMGPLLDEPFTKQLDGKLRELRFYLVGGRHGSRTGSLRTAGSSCSPCS